MIFAAPKVLWLAILTPVTALAAVLFWQRYLRKLRAWASAGIWQRVGLTFSKRHLVLSILCLCVAVLGTSIALARPRWGVVETTVERQGVDVVFLLDSSLSMATADVAPSRLSIAKSLVRRLAANLPGHRVALVQAEGRGLVLAPLTIDTAVVDLLLDTVIPGSLPDPGTRLAPALTEAIKLYPPDGEKHRVLVIVSDGEDHGSAWQDSLQTLKDSGVVVHTLGVGTSRGGPIPLAPGASSSPESGKPDDRYKQDEDGRVVVSRLNEGVLEQLASETGGTYVPVPRAGADPSSILRAIESMQKRSFDSESLEVLAERFQWPLGLAALALLLHLLAAPLTSTPHLSGAKQ